jgi:hypothetical protein
MTNNMTTDFQERLATLTPKEEKYFRIILSRYGVLYIQAKPGVAKSAIARSIANKLDLNYVDMRLAMSDESDFKYPYLEDKDYGDGKIKVSSYAVPRWAYEANQRPTLIHFEELNRAPQFVRNAALQILLEREIGSFKFNDNVFMMASGNMGEEDKTDVEEFDSALNNRLIHVNHTLTPEEWITDFADKNCHRLITSFIQAHPERMYQDPNENSKAYATPRSWTMLSEFIVQNWGKEASPREFLPMLKEVATSYLGNTAVKFIQYCEDMMNISITDVLNNYDRVKKDLDKYNRDKNSELIQSLKAIDITTLTDKQLENASKFLKGVGDDEKTAYLLHVLDSPSTDISNQKIKKFMLEFRDLLSTIRKINKPD